MQLRYVESFLKLYEVKNISKACSMLFISQQGLSRQIKALESDLGVKLFNRTKSGVTPTDIAVNLYSGFQKMYKEYIEIIQTVHNKKSGSSNDIVIAFAYGISAGLNTDVIMNFQRANPEISFQIKEYSKSGCIDKLLNNDIDIALLVNPFNTELFETQKLTEGYMYIAVHKDHPYAGQGFIDFKQLNGEKIITGSQENTLRELFDYYCEITDITPNIMFSSSYSLDIINSESCQVCMATVTPIMAEKITNKNFKVVRLITPEPGYLYCCTSKSRIKSLEVKTVVDFIREYFKQIPLIDLKT